MATPTLDTKRTLATLAAVALVVLSTARAADAQDPPREIAVAERLAEEGRHAAAADTLLAYLGTHPDEAGVRWRAAQLLRSAGRVEEALGQYGAALSLTPGDPWLRLEHADLLTSLGRFDEARAVARPLAETTDAPDEARTQALTLLGTLAYWQGDLPTAIRRFEAALAMDPDRAEPARQLREIRALTRPWARLALEGLDDDQPYRRGSATLEAGAFVTPLWTVVLEATPHVLDPAPGGGDVGGETGTAGRAYATVKGFLPDARLEVAAGVGAALRWESSTWLGHAAVGLRLPEGIVLGARAERERYLWTVTSADTLLVQEAVEVSLDRSEHPGWAGRAAVRRESFPGDNRIRTAYAWILAPVWEHLRLGASAAWQDADETRWTPDFERYLPYFTPEQRRELSLLGEVTLPLGATTARINGSWAAWAREDAPTAGSAPGEDVVFFDRSYSPWGLRGSLDVPAGDDLSLRVEAERQETAFYTLDRASIVLLLRLGSSR